MEHPTTDVSGILLAAGAQFPTITKDKIPDPAMVLRHIRAGQRAMRTLYAQLEGRVAGDSRCVSVLLRRDWERRFRGLLAAAGPILRTLGVMEESDEVLPTPAQIENIVLPLAGAGPEKVIGLVADFAPRAMICHRMVPWVSDLKEIYEHFCSCVEAEDGHMATVDILADLVRPLDTTPSP